MRLIFSKTPQSPLRHSSFTGGNKRKPLSGASGKLFVALALAGIGYSFAPSTASAGLFSFLGGLKLLGSEKMLASEDRSMNLQNMPLLQPAVHLDPNPAKGGGDIMTVAGTALLPETGPSGSLADIDDDKHGGKISVYVVRSGDSLGDIAKMFSVSVNTIVWANDLKGGAIRPGETLIILPVSGVRHTIAKGDTVERLAKKYKADADEIRQFNDIPEGGLAVGDVVIIPDGEVSAPAAPSSIGKRVRGSNGPSYDGYYLRPVVGGRKSQGLHGYNGVDLASAYASPILAAASGDVIVAKNYGWNGGYGQYIVIAHDNGTQTLYGHLSGLVVSPGMPVVRGQVIGFMGSTGKSTGTHVHFEIRGAKNPF